MTSENERLLKNIKEEQTVNQISLDMNISNKKIFQRIKNLSVNGYSFSRQYYYNGDIKYILNKSFSSAFAIYSVVAINAKNSILSTKIILFGPDAFTGTAAPFTIVKAGVRS